jgi:hypothetical protein
LPRLFDAKSAVERPTSADGKRLVYLERREDAEDGAPALQLMFLFNFLDELRRKTPLL